jgi:F0F1-type ATP synthase assembly protein I
MGGAVGVAAPSGARRECARPRRLAAWLAAGLSVLAWLVGCAQAGAAARCDVSTADGYAQAVLGDHPVAYYRLDDAGDGLLCDASPNHNDGRYATSGIRYGQPGALSGAADTAIEADGRVDPAESGRDSGIAGAHPFTLEGWFRATRKQDEMVVSIGEAGAQNMAGVGPWVDAGGSYISVDTYDGAFPISTRAAHIDPYDGRWHEVAAAYSATAQTVTVYLDGRRLGAARVADHPLPSPIRIGWWVDTLINQPFAGSLDEVAIYPTALTAAQVAAHYAAGTGPSGPRVSSIASSIPSPWDSFHSVGAVVASGAIAIGGALFLTFPSNLFNLTFQENYGEIRDWARRLSRALTRRLAPPLRSRAPRSSSADPAGSKAARETAGAATTWPVFALVVLVGSLLGCLLDPGFGSGLGSLATFLATLLALLLGVGVSAAVVAGYHRGRHGSVPMALQALPWGLAVAAFCVLVSRLTSFQPGYLYGVVAGVTVARTLPRHEQGHVVALSILARVAVSVVAWFALVPVGAAAQRSGASFALVLAADFLGAIFVSGLVGSVISLFPLQFLPGWTLKEWRRDAWGALFLACLFLLVQVLLQPRSGHGSPAPLATTIALFVVFGGGSVALRELFAVRRRNARGEPTPAMRERLRQLLAPTPAEVPAPATASAPVEAVTAPPGEGEAIEIRGRGLRLPSASEAGEEAHS